MPRDIFGDVVEPHILSRPFPQRLLSVFLWPFMAIWNGKTKADRERFDRFSAALNQDQAPRELAAELEGMWHWALNNRRAARRAAILFWALKLPALAFASAGGLLSYLGNKPLAISASALASFCILLDALQPRGRLRNAHLRAFHEITNRLSEAVSDWRVARLEGSATPTKAAEIIVRTRRDAKSIEKFIEDAAASLDERIGHMNRPANRGRSAKPGERIRCTTPE